MEKISFRELLSIAFMVFSIFFGAGNLIFPPFIAQNAGTSFPVATAGFLLTAIGLPLLGLVAIARQGGSYANFLGQRLAPWFISLLMIILYLAIGPLFAVPRTAAVSFEIGIYPFLAIDDLKIGRFIYSAIFFILTYILAVNPNKIADNVGKILTPILLFFLAGLFIRTFYAPIGTILPPTRDFTDMPFAAGFTNGYLTMDLLAAIAIGPLATMAIRQKGIKDNSCLFITTLKACLIAVILMSIVYVSLAYMGATCPSVLGYYANGGLILSAVTYVFFGEVGKIVLAIIMGFACLTTSVGLCSIFAVYFEEKLQGYIGYKKLLILAIFISFFISNIGLDTLITITVPFLSAIYPIFILLVLISIVDNGVLKNKIYYKLSIFMIVPFCILDGMQAAGLQVPEVERILSLYLPLYNVNMGWVLPAGIGLALAYLKSRL